MDRECPICGSIDREMVSVVESYDGDYHPSECRDCGFLYTPDPRDETASRTPESTIPDGIPRPKPRHHYITNLILNHLDRGSHVLEVGAGFGSLGQLLEESGYIYRGYEPSEKRAAVASDGGLDVVPEVYSADGQKYDAVIFDNVLEHVDDPRSVIQTAAESLQDRGLVVTIVPNRYDVRRLHPGWRDEEFWQSSHINYFSGGDLEGLYREAGLSFAPFDRSAIGVSETKDKAYWLSTFASTLGVYPFGLYCYGVRQ